MSVGKRMVPSSNYASNHVDGNNGLVSFCTAKHDKIGRSTLIDMADWFEVGLLDLGHEVTFSDDHLEARAINVFCCRFIHNFARRHTKSRSESIFDTNHRGIQPGFLGA